MAQLKKVFSVEIIILTLSFLLTTIKSDEIEQKIAKINNQGFPESVLYEAAGVNPGGRAMTKAQLAKALEDPQIQAAATRAALEYATKTAEIKVPPSNARGGETSSYCEYSWVTWLPFMDCAISDSIESTEKSVVKETGSNCYNVP